MADYADWTESIELLGSEIMVPTDCQGATIMVPFDVQGATIMMPIDIQGQTINLQVDIVAQTIGSIAIDISAQSIGELTIDVAAQSVGVYLQPEWAAKGGADKNFYGVNPNQPIDGSAVIEYTVPAGKTLFLSGAGCGMRAYAAADYDHFLYVRLTISDVTDEETLAEFGGLGGVAISLNKPVVIPGGHDLNVIAFNGANVNCNIEVSAWGYEV